MGRVCGRKHFIRSLSGRFPEIAAAIPIYSRGLLHCEMGTFAATTREALDRGDLATARAHLDFAEELWRVAGPALENALAVSYLEHIDFDKSYGRSAPARDMLPPGLRSGLAELEEHLRRLYAPREVRSGRRSH
jgi:hypothetical protein